MSQKKFFLWRLLGWAWRLVVGLYRLAVVVILIGGLAWLWLQWRGAPTVHVGHNVALVVHPYGHLVDQLTDGGQQWLQQISGQPPVETSLRSLRKALDDAASDSRIRLAVLNLDDMDSASIPQLQELARSVDRFRRAGKPVYAYGAAFDQYQYLLAAHANAIALDPMGMVLLQGLAIYGDYFKDALDKLGVQVNVFRVGQYKSAVEPFIRNDMSPAAKLANRAWLGDLWQVYQQDVTHSRGLPLDAISQYIQGYSDGLMQDGGDAAHYALKNKLVDTVERRDAFRKMIETKVGEDRSIGTFRQIDALDYARVERRQAKEAPNRIARVVVQGDIVDGSSTQRAAGGDTIASLLDRTRLDSSVSAVVLRVNSPGGSVTAAEKIRRAVLRLKAAGKPVVVSMSTLAASGGYWISMDADRIYAEPTTITGSIGIFGLLPTIEKPLEKLGIHSDGVGTTPLAGAFRMDRPLGQPEQEIIQSEINFGYRQFTEGVAKGRGLPIGTVQQIAQGRVWSGLEAKKLGLVDAFGGLEAATTEAARLAKLAPGSYRVKVFRPQPELLQKILQRFTFGGRSRADVVARMAGLDPHWLQPLIDTVRLLRDFNDPEGAYAYCFCTPRASTRGH